MAQFCVLAVITLFVVLADALAFAPVPGACLAFRYEPQSVLTHGCVRNAIRNAILDLGESVASYMGGGADDAASGSSNSSNNNADPGFIQTAVIDVYEALHVLVRIVALRRRPVEDKLRRLYIQVGMRRWLQTA